jgi:hypothetical protein
MPAALLLALVICSAQPAASLLTLEIRVFAGSTEVTGETRVAVHRAGERGQPIGSVAAEEPRVLVQVPPGIYDAQVLREKDGRVLNIRWAQRLVVMPYPDEDGHHLEVINFMPGYGALQIRTVRPDPTLSFGLARAGRRHDALSAAAAATGDALFVVPAGLYDLEVRRGSQSTWHTSLDIPLDRTRLWVVP